MIDTFDSVEEFALACKPLSSFRANDSAWYGSISYNDAVQRALTGDESYVEGAERILNQLDVDLPSTQAFGIVRSPYGGRVNLSDWLSGSPDPMRRRVRINSEYGPLKIVVSTTSSCGVDAETMKRRGYTILALLLKLQQIRPIQLYLLAELYGRPDGWNYQMIRVESQPLAVGVAAFGLCNVGFARHLTYTYGRHHHGFNGDWPLGYDGTSYRQVRRERLVLADDDLVIDEVHVTDTLISQPLEWLKNQLTKYSGQK